MGDVYILNGKILSGLPNHAKDIIFDNDGTTLSSTNTEDAIKEVSSNIATSVTEIDISTHLIGVANKLRLFRFGKLRLLDYHGSKNLTIATYTQIGSLSASDVPSYTLTSIGSLGANMSTLAVYPNGEISVRSEEESIDYCAHLLVWFVN